MAAPAPQRQVRRTAALEQEILARLAAGETLRAICRDQHMPREASVREWAVDEPFASQYARARRLGLDSMAEETIAIADDVTLDPAGRRIAVDARKWLLSKMRPDKYGDRLATEISGPAGAPVQVQMEINAAKESLAARIDSIAARLGESADSGGNPG